MEMLVKFISHLSCGLFSIQSEFDLLFRNFLMVLLPRGLSNDMSSEMFSGGNFPRFYCLKCPLSSTSFVKLEKHWMTFHVAAFE